MHDPSGTGGHSEFIDSLMDTELYSIRGLEAYARDGGAPLEETFETLLTGLAVRYYKAVAG